MESEYFRKWRNEWDRNDWLTIVLYGDSIQCDEDGWFSVDEIIRCISKMVQFDLRALIMRVEGDADHRYIFNEDRTLLRISPEHIAPKYVEEEMKTAGDLKVEPSVFEINMLPYVEDRQRQIVFTSSDGSRWQFPYETNKVFYLDKQRFFMLVETDGRPALTVCAFLSKDRRDQYRMLFRDFPDVLNYIFAVDSELVDYEGKQYRTSVEPVQ